MNPRWFTQWPGEQPTASIHRTFTQIRIERLDRANAAQHESKHIDNRKIAGLEAVKTDRHLRLVKG